MPSAVGQTVDMEALLVGQHALLVECADADQVLATYQVLRSRAEDLGVRDIVPAARTVLLDGLLDRAAALALVQELQVDAASAAGAAPAQEPASRVDLPTRYDGPDLDEVARQWRCTTAEVVRRHQQTEFVVSFCGFTPGFAYCSGLPADLVVSRRADPRPAVPAGSVALAGEYTGVYPTATPGGWQLIGTTSASLWKPGEAHPALLSPGTRVRFVDV